METRISTKFAALSIALLVNCIMIGAVAYLFSGQVHAASIVHPLAATATLALNVTA